MSKAKRMIRSTPRRVKIAVSVATSSGRPRCTRPPWPAYSPSLFSRTITQSRSPGPTSRSGEVMPGRMRVGRTLAYWSRPWQIGSRRPHSVTWSGMFGIADRAEIDRVGGAQPGEPVRRHELAVPAIPVGTPVVVVDDQLESAVARGHGVQHFEAGADDLGADAVGGNGGDAVLAHGRYPRPAMDLSRRTRVGNVACDARAARHSCHCEEQSDAAISIVVRNWMGIASLRSQ